MAADKPASEVPGAGGRAFKALNVKTLSILASVFVVEGLAIFMCFVLAGGPSDARADEVARQEAAEAAKPVELLVVAERFPNTLTGRTYLYDTEVFIQVRRKHKQIVEEKLEQMAATIKSDIAQIFRAAKPGHLHEPTLATLRRQIRARLSERLGHDAEEESLLRDVLIPRCTQFRADL